MITPCKGFNDGPGSTDYLPDFAVFLDDGRWLQSNAGLFTLIRG